MIRRAGYNGRHASYAALPRRSQAAPDLHAAARAARARLAPGELAAARLATGIVPGLSRAFCALVFAATPTLETRFAGAALTIVCLGLAGFVAALAYIAWKMNSAPSFTLLTPDVAALGVLIPTIVVASGIEVADSALGGRSAHFLLACLAVLGVLGIVACGAAALGVERPTLPPLATLAGALSIAVVLGGGERFAAGSLANGLSAAWMAAGLTTVAAGFFRRACEPCSRRPPTPASPVWPSWLARPPAAGPASAAATRLAYIVAVVAGMAMLGLPRFTARFERELEPMVSNRAAYFPNPSPRGEGLRRGRSANSSSTATSRCETSGHWTAWRRCRRLESTSVSAIRRRPRCARRAPPVRRRCRPAAAS